jgi:hypothetical protein
MASDHDESTVREYPCWCDDQDGCEGVASEPFGLCPTCVQFRHGRAPRHGMTADDMDEKLGYPSLSASTGGPDGE